MNENTQEETRVDEAARSATTAASPAAESVTDAESARGRNRFGWIVVCAVACALLIGGMSLFGFLIDTGESDSAAGSLASSSYPHASSQAEGSADASASSSASEPAGAEGTESENSASSAVASSDSSESKSSSSNEGAGSATSPGSSSSAPAPAPAEPEAPEPATITVSVYVDSSRAAASGKWSGSSCLASKKVTLPEGSSVYDALKATGLGISGSSSYVRSIGGLAEFQCGQGSGWLYSVNGVQPGYSCGKYKLKGGESIRWIYTCDMGNDV